MPWNALILPLVAGYYLLTRFYPFKYRQQRLDRQRLIFESILLAVVTSAITFAIKIIIPVNYIEFIYAQIPIQTPYIGTSIATLLFTVVFTETVNLFIDKTKYIKQAIKSVGNEFELIIKSSFVEKKLIQITLSSGKVYVAWVKELPIPSISNYIRLIPAMSGYRTQEGEVAYTTHYLTVYSDIIQKGSTINISELDVDLVLSNSEVVSISYFDYEMYEKFNSLKVGENK